MPSSSTPPASKSIAARFTRWKITTTDCTASRWWAGFACAGRRPEQAFTFSLVDIHTDPDETAQELDALADVFRVVRDDGRREDDVILLGDLNVDDHHLGRLGQLSHVHWVLSGVASNTRGTKLYDNVVFSDLAYDRVHRGLGRVRHDPRVQPDGRRGAGNIGSYAGLGRVRFVRRGARLAA